MFFFLFFFVFFFLQPRGDNYCKKKKKKKKKKRIELNANLLPERLSEKLREKVSRRWRDFCHVRVIKTQTSDSNLL